MMPQVAAAAAVTVSRLVQLPVMAQPFKNIPRTIQANNFWLFMRSPPYYTKHNFNSCWISKQCGSKKNLRDQENPQMLPRYPSAHTPEEKPPKILIQSCLTDRIPPIHTQKPHLSAIREERAQPHHLRCYICDRAA
jgi:hypothetical protein